jgi:hypothetical protein
MEPREDAGRNLDKVELVKEHSFWIWLFLSLNPVSPDNS